MVHPVTFESAPVDEFDEPPTQVHSVQAMEQEAPSQPLRRGDACGRYLILEELGRGGLGVVYAAYDPELHRKVAIKLLRFDRIPDAELMGGVAERLMREAQAMASVTHPNVVSIYDVGRDRKQVFIAMEMIDGLNLRQWVKRGAQDWQTIRDVFVGAARGLEAAHAVGLVHRDFKPPNVMVDARGRARVLDFGLARSWMRSASTESEPVEPLDALEGPASSDYLVDVDLTAADVVVGTPQYMAPEQFRKGGDVGPHSDQFAFFIALWEAFYGQRPFKGRSLTEIFDSMKAEKLRRPPDTKVPKWLHAAMVKGLSFPAAERFDSMTDVIEALTFDKRRRRRGWLAVGLTALLSGSAVASASFLWQPELEAAERSVVDELEREAHVAAARGFFVFPPLDEPDAATAYVKVLALEQLEGQIQHLGAERAKALRDEFAGALTRLGDRFWDSPDARPFAYDFYAMALVFDPDHERARSRNALTAGEIAAVAEKARTQSFSERDRASGEVLAALAASDEEERAHRLHGIARRPEAKSLSRSSALAEFIETEGVPQNSHSADVAGAPDGSDAPIPEAAPEGDRIVDELSTAEPQSNEDTAKDEPRESLSRAQRSRRAKAAIADGMRASKRGEWAEARRHFHQALNHRPGHPGALAGLAEIEFQNSAYERAASLISKALERSPRHQGYLVLLGDAKFKVFDYSAAWRAYQKAAELGSKTAERRLARLEAKMGG